MNHIITGGSPEYIGRQTGSSVIFQKELFPAITISQKRHDFAIACWEILRQTAPALQAEIKGFAEGLKIPLESAVDFLLPMYSFSYDHACSCFAFAEQDRVIFGRNSDFDPAIKEMSSAFLIRPQAGYRFLGHSTAWIEMEDGVNEQGLAVGLTFVYPSVIKPGLNAGLLVRYLLEHCADTESALKTLKELPIASSQTLTLADCSGNLAVAECNCERMSIRRGGPGQPVCAANHFVSAPMLPYACTLPDQIASHKRYAAMEAAFIKETPDSLSFAMELLSGKKGYVCQTDPDRIIDTIWSVALDLTSSQGYRSEGDPSLCPFQPITDWPFKDC